MLPKAVSKQSYLLNYCVPICHSIQSCLFKNKEEIDGNIKLFTVDYKFLHLAAVTHLLSVVQAALKIF